MITTIQPGGLKGLILAPASKSSMQRACAAALLRVGETVIHHPGHSNDDKAALRVIQALGAKVETLADGSLLVRSAGMLDGARTAAGKAGAGAAGAGKDRAGEAAPGEAGAGKAGAGEAVPGEVNCGESGLGLRMFAPIIGLSSHKISVVGEGSLLKRPMDFFDEIFPQLGIRVVSNGGKLPLEIQGPLQPRDIEIDGSLSSQFLTGLLFAFAAAGAPGVTIRVRDLKSKPYIDLTLQVMKHFGWEIGNRKYEEFTFTGAHKTGARDYTVEGDWSGGAFLLVAGALAGPVTVRGLDASSTQADKAIVRAICDAGAFFEDREEGMVVGPATGAGAAGGKAAGSADTPGAGGSGLRAFRFDATDCPDLFPPLVALAAYCDGTSEILGVSRLAHKESDRGLTLQQEFGKMGVKIELDGDRMLVEAGRAEAGRAPKTEGRKPDRPPRQRGANGPAGGSGGEGRQWSGGVAAPQGATVHSRHDHRIAMACAVAALKAAGPVTIEEADAINKSYPDFYFHLQQLGAQVNIQA